VLLLHNEFVRRPGMDLTGEGCARRACPFPMSSQVPGIACPRSSTLLPCQMQVPSACTSMASRHLGVVILPPSSSGCGGDTD